MKNERLTFKYFFSSNFKDYHNIFGSFLGVVGFSIFFFFDGDLLCGWEGGLLIFNNSFGKNIPLMINLLLFLIYFLA